MEFSTQTTASLHQIKTPALAVGVFTDGMLSEAADIIDRAGNGAIGAIEASEFSGKAGSTLVLRNIPGVTAQRIILVGLGKQSEYNRRNHVKAEQAVAAAAIAAGVSEAVSTLLGIETPDATLRIRARNAAAAASQAGYRFTQTLSKPEAAPSLEKITHWVGRSHSTEAQKGLREGRAIGNGQLLARHLGDLPPNVCTPSYLGDTAKQLAKEFKSLKAQVLTTKDIEALGMGSFLSVAKGSDQPPVFIVLKYAPPSAKGGKKGKTQAAPTVLVGKGITFDTGGISLKPAANMVEMKYDMCGAASVLGSMRAVAELELDREVVALVPACENLPSGRANKPGDVVTSMSGKTIEVLNTDAEGRLILCDALTYAERFKPAAVIDVATLTGACVVALGNVNAGLFSTHDDLAEALLAAGKQSGDTAWRMPLDDDYQEQLKSKFADVANIGGPPAGSVTAACFLSRFAEAYPWAHLDIAGVAWRNGKEKGATGRPVPLLVNYLLSA